VGPRRIVLVGNPNVGKSVVFGRLAAAYATVSNYPGTTVEVARARARHRPDLEVVDTPGIASLLPGSEDERVTRDILLAGVEGVVQVADAKNLPRALAVSLELAEAGFPFVVALNMVDEAAERGLAIDVPALAGLLGVSVVSTVAVRGRGMRALAAAVGRAAPSPRRVRYPGPVERALVPLERHLDGLGASPRWLGLMCLAGDETLRPWLAARLAPAALAAIEDVRREVEVRLHGSVPYHLARARMLAAARLAREVVRSRPHDVVGAEGGRAAPAFGLLALVAALVLVAGDLGLAGLARGPARLGAWSALAGVALAACRSAGLRTALGRWAAGRGTGVVVLAVVLYVVYRFVGVFAAGTAVDFLEERLFGTYLNPAVAGAIDALVARLPASGPAASLLILVRNLLVGPYGLLTLALTYALALILPIVSAFFLVFSLLEDSGYLPRLAVVVNRGFRSMGLNGKAVLPMVLGLGCDTMATLTARIMETRKERLLVTLLLALGVPCSAQLAVILALFGALPAWAPLVWGAAVAAVLVAVGFLAAHLLPGERSELILELPPMRRPELRNIALKTLGRVEWYLREAVPIFVLGTLVLFALDATQLLAVVVRAGEPVVVGVLGLPARAAEAFLVGFFRRDYGAAGIYALFRDQLLSPAEAVVALVTLTLFVPCIANFFVVVKESGLSTALAVAGFIFPLAFAVGGLVRLALRTAGLP
jgi:ferrous iron transport protein B